MQVHNVVLMGGQTKEGFIRDSLIQLYSACDAPETIDSVELREVDESVYQFLSCYGEFDVEYTAEIGYDRCEQYLGEVREYDANLRKTVSKTVVKERIVTDWRPHSGKSHQTTASLEFLEDSDAVDYGDLDPAIAEKYDYYSYDENEIVGSGAVVDDEQILAQYSFAEPTDAQLKYVLSRASNLAEYRTCSELPGDKERNFRAETNLVDADFTVFATKRFKTAFDFRGKTHYLKQFVTESEPQIYCSAIHSDEEANMLRDAEKKELEADLIIQKNKKYAVYTHYAFAGFIALAILFGIALPSLSGNSGIKMFLVGVLGAIASYLVGSKVFQKKADNQERMIKERFRGQIANHFHNLQEKKIGMLNARLCMMGQEPLSECELEWFSEEKKHRLDANYKILAK